MKKQLENMQTAIDEAKSMKDQLDEARHMIEKSQKAEATLEKYKKKLEESNDLRRQMKVWDEWNFR